MIVTVYCSGSIQKGPSDSGKTCWTDAERAAITRGAHPLDVRFLKPEDPADDLANTVALFGRDMYQVQFGDFVVVDARERRGIGIGVEVLASRVFGTPLVIVAPPNSYYRLKSLSYRGSTVANYVHPHLQILADAIVDDFEQAGAWIRRYIDTPTKPKGPEILFRAIEKYRAEMLPTDQPMLVILREMETGGPASRSPQKSAKRHNRS